MKHLRSLLLILPLAVASACGPDYPACDDDDDCHEGEFCVDGQCQQCRGDDDCPVGSACNGGRCDPIPGYCDAEHPCPSGQRCEDNRCVSETPATECDAERACPEGQRCEQGRCITQGGSTASCNFESVYFAFNVDALDTRARNTLAADAACIRERGLGAVHLTGHADERGTEEYNMALGERRARSAERYLLTLGIGGARTTISSMGEEAATGTDAAAWANDRRVDLHAR